MPCSINVIRARRRIMGYVSQFLRVVPRVPALDVVAEVLIGRGFMQAEARGAATDMLLRLNIPRRLHSLPPATFSGGEQQRVNLARGFIGNHPVLLLDEPTASLDAANRRVVVAMINEAKADGTAIIAICHDSEVRDAIETARSIVLDTLRIRGTVTARATQSLIRLESADQIFGALIGMSDLLKYATPSERTVEACR